MSDPEDRELDRKVAKYLGDWDAFDQGGQLKASWSPTTDIELANRFRELVESALGPVTLSDPDDPRAVVLDCVMVLGKARGWEET